MTKQKSRWLSGFMAAAMLFTSLAVPIPQQTTASAHWADPSLTKLRDWGVMRGDQNGSMEPDRKITRSEFVSMVNRAFGYKKLGKQPFKDVKGTEWYANEINIGFNQGYFKGSSKNTASPNDPLTREEAAVLVGRNLMLTPDESENMQFKDGRNLSAWSRGIVTAAAKKGILRGETDGSFRPQASITRGEVASMLERTIGTPINQSGSRSLGMVHGNVMISAPDVELSDTVINGDLYITAGVDLGFVKLNNVRVTGQIIAAGAGVSNRDANSILLRNTTAGEMIIDSPNNVAISVRADGETNIGKTFVRTSAYLEDMCYGGNGFQSIEIDGEEGTRVDLTGNFKDVVLKSPKGVVALGRGTIKKLSVDEKAFGASVNIDEDAVINELYLDTGTTVTGAGDVGYVKINTEGTTMSMLPDKVEIRPGIVATVAGQKMNSKDALLASSYPHIRAGYPKVNDIAPNAANALVNTNKTGTMYWGITYKEDNALSSEELIAPPSYGAKALTKGQSNIQQAETDIKTAISSLKTDTEYTFSVVMKDARGNVSQRKARTFRTPDNTIPNFAPGYPRIVKDGYENDDHTKDFYTQVEAVITKNSTLYYAVYDKGLPAPTLDELRTQTMTGHVKGTNGKLEVKKNEPLLFKINGLKEQTEYDLYLMATDGINHSPVKKLSFKTSDLTPPEFNTKYPRPDNAKEKSVDVLYNVNEDATVYWVAVKYGDTYPVPPEGWDEQHEVPLDSDEAKFQVMSGSNAKLKGKATASKDKEGRFTISGLDIQTTYDVYLLPVDKAGNQAKEVTKIAIKTLDVLPPTAELKFEPEVNGQPLVESDISIVFNELIRVQVGEKGRELLHDQKGEKLFDAINRNFKFLDVTNQIEEEVKKNFTEQNVVCTAIDGKTILTFKGEKTEDGNKIPAALDLDSGSKYRIELGREIYDTSNNRIEEKSRILEFTTVFSRIVQTEIKDRPIDINMAFELRPQSQKVSDNIYFDLIVWSKSNIEFEIQEKVEDPSAPEGFVWKDIKGEGDKTVTGTIARDGAISLYRTIAEAQKKAPDQLFQRLKDFRTSSYAFRITKLNGRPVNEGNDTVKVYTVPVAGNYGDVEQLSRNPSVVWDALVGEKVIMIGTPTYLYMNTVLTDTNIPKFVDPTPTFKTGDSKIVPTVQVDRKATLHYVVAPVGSIPIKMTPPDGVKPEDYTPPQSGSDQQPKSIESPVPEGFKEGTFGPGIPGAVYGKYAGPNDAGIQPHTLQNFEIKGLKPETDYDIFFVLTGTPQTPSPVHWYRLRTGHVKTPDIILKNDISSTGADKISVAVTEDAHIWWKLYATNALPKEIKDAEVTHNKKNQLIPAKQSAEFELKKENSTGLAGIANLIMGMNGTNDVVKAEGQLDISRPMGDEGQWIYGAIELKELELDQSYTLVALTKNALSDQEATGKGRLYRLDDIIKRSRKPPVITSLVVSQLAPEDKDFYSANVTINFSKALYYRNPGDTTAGRLFPMDVPQWSLKEPPKPKKDGQPQEIVMESGLTDKDADFRYRSGKGDLLEGNKKAHYQVEARVYKWKVGDKVKFPAQITDKYGVDVPAPGNFTLELQLNNQKKPNFIARLGDSVVESNPDLPPPPQPPQPPQPPRPNRKR